MITSLVKTHTPKPVELPPPTFDLTIYGLSEKEMRKFNALFNSEKITRFLFGNNHLSISCGIMNDIAEAGCRDEGYNEYETLQRLISS